MPPHKLVMSKIFKLSKCLNTQQNNPNFDKLIYLAKSFLAENKIIALPTDTVYGLAANVQSFDAIHRLYKIKGRDRGKPLAICLGDIDEIYQYCEVTIPKTLLVQLLPGPITVVFQSTAEITKFLNPRTNLIGIRIPKNEFIRRICRVSGPIALTSANHSLEGSTISVEQFRDLWPQIDGIFDGGPLNENNPKALGSTVIDFSKKGFYTILREGVLHQSTIKLIEEFGLKKSI